MTYQHLQIAYHDTIASIMLDYQGKSANILSQEMIAELSNALTMLEASDTLTGVTLCSAKKSGFVFGADITEFESLQHPDEVRSLQKTAMALLDRIEASPLISVALLHGPVLGGGLELAIACDYRLIREEGRIMVGFPEANLGLMPGFAGTARGARLIGAKACLEMCLSAKPVTSAKTVLASGLADGLYEEATSVPQSLAQMAKGKREFAGPATEQAATWQEVISQAKSAHLAGKQADHIPHLAAILSHFDASAGDYDALIQGELTHFPRLMLDPISANLRRVFALTDKVKKQARGTAKIRHVQIIGAGTMGADIATYLCLKGLHVYLCDVNEAALQSAYARAERYFERKTDPAGARQALSRFTCGLHEDNTTLIDLVIEAAPEKLPVKQQIWQALEASHRQECLFATNSSALDLDRISEVMKDSARLTGLHFFNPATVMPLIEVIHRPQSKPGDIERLMTFSLEMGKLPIKVQNSPGFLVNRALLPYIYEAIAMHLEGGAADEIDQALLSHGMPMGPLELADQIGLDICLDVGMRLNEGKMVMSDDVKTYLHDKISVQRLGRKTGSGIYHWDGKSAQRAYADYPADSSTKIIKRVLAPMISACQAILKEGHVSEADFIDAALIYGIGYPRHTGGLLHALPQDAQDAQDALGEQS